MVATSVVFASVDSFAGQTQWLETDGGNVRIVMEPIEPGAAKARGIIDIQLTDGWTTYWRDPGSGGIPPSIQLNDEQDLELEAIWFPEPVLVQSSYGAYAGYTSPVQIPFSIQSPLSLREGEISARLMVGICKDICIPAFADMMLPIEFANGTSTDLVMVQRAIEALPKPPRDLGLIVKASIDESQEITIVVSGAPLENALFVSGLSNQQFGQATLVSETEGKRTYRVKPLREMKADVPTEVYVTGLTDQGAFETKVNLNF